MFTTTLTASWSLFWLFRANAARAVSAIEKFNFNLDAVLVAMMAALAVVSLADMLVKWTGYLSGRLPMKTSEVTVRSPVLRATSLTTGL